METVGVDAGEIAGLFPDVFAEQRLPAERADVVACAFDVVVAADDAGGSDERHPRAPSERLN